MFWPIKMVDRGIDNVLINIQENKPFFKTPDLVGEGGRNNVFSGAKTKLLMKKDFAGVPGWLSLLSIRLLVSAQVMIS